MSTRLERYRDHCRRMSEAQHKPECPSLTAREPYWDQWEHVQDNCGQTTCLVWRGPKPKWEPPGCDGCMTDAERALFARLAGEVDDYLQGVLL